VQYFPPFYVEGSEGGDILGGEERELQFGGSKERSEFSEFSKLDQIIYHLLRIYNELAGPSYSQDRGRNQSGKKLPVIDLKKIVSE
jgi:hypothetical protein